MLKFCFSYFILKAGSRVQARVLEGRTQREVRDYHEDLVDAVGLQCVARVREILVPCLRRAFLVPFLFWSDVANTNSPRIMA